MNTTRDGDAYRLEMTQWLPLPPDELFPFFADAHNLERITPGLLRFEVLPGAPKPGQMREGALIDYKLRVHGVPIRWRTRIEQWDPPRKFIDTQLKGPYQLWHHTHLFEPKTRDGVNGTLCTDIVRYRPPGGPLMGLVNRLFVQRDVEAIFAHRAKVLDEMFNRGSTQPASEQQPRKCESPKSCSETSQ